MKASLHLSSGAIGSKTSNPLKQVLNAIEENVECAVYDQVSQNLNPSH